MNVSFGGRAASITLAVGALALLACDERDIVAEFVGAALPGPCPGDVCDAGNATADAGNPNGPAVAWCACEDLLAATTVTLRADANQGTLASIATRGGVHLQAPLVIDGSLLVGPDKNVSATSEGALQIGGELGVDGDIDADIVVDVGGDAYVAGDVRVRALQVAGVLTVPAGRELSVRETLDYTALRRAPVQVAAPCACDDDDLSPAASRLDEARGANDVMRLDDTRYGNFVGAATMSLGCGEHWVENVVGDGDLVIDVQRPATLYVAGTVSIEGELDVQLAQGAALTLVVAGDVRVGGQAALGVPELDARVEIIADGGQVRLNAGGTLHGAVIAPAAELVVDGPLRMRGSARTRRIVANAEVDATFVSQPAPPSCN